MILHQDLNEFAQLWADPQKRKLFEEFLKTFSDPVEKQARISSVSISVICNRKRGAQLIPAIPSAEV
jgi:hypothetical protein